MKDDLAALASLFDGTKLDKDKIKKVAKSNLPGDAATAMNVVANPFAELGSRLGPMAVEAIRPMGEKIVAEVRTWPGKVTEAFSAMSAALSSVVGKLQSEIASWPGRLAGAISAMGAAIVSAVGNAIKSVNPFSGVGGPATTPSGRMGISPGAGGGRYHPSAYTGQNGVPPARTTTAALHTHVHLDGKQIAQVVTKHQVASAEFPNSLGGHDSHGRYYPSGLTAMPT